MEAVILAGGLGTRLRSEVADLPKILAPIGERPFIFYLLDFLRLNGTKRVILATGYLHEQVEKVIGQSWQGVEVAYSREEEPLGTGGAIRLALHKAEQPHVFVLNGDTLFTVPLHSMIRQHQAKGPEMTMALKHVENAERYGTVGMADDGRVIEFVEKQAVAQGFINGGVYLMKRDIFDELTLPERFSLENDFFRPFVDKVRIYGFKTDAYFIDIGIPEDYKRAQDELSR